MSKSLNVAVVGATGTTGSAIIAGLLGSTETSFTVRALASPASVNKPAYKDLESRGVKVISVDLQGPERKLVEALSGVDVVISAILFTELDSEIPLANAAKAAGVKRFLQSAMMVVIPPRGVVDLREKVIAHSFPTDGLASTNWTTPGQKEEIFNHIQKIRLPYTYLDAGWWYDIAIPTPPSRIAKDQDGAAMQGQLGADGNVPIALADIGDIGRYVAKVIADPRTLNKRVFVYNEVKTQNQIYDLVEKLSGETIQRSFISADESEALIKKAKAAASANPSSPAAIRGFVVNQLFHSITIRGDNTPDNAKYLGYLDGKELYPDFNYSTVEDYVKARA